MPHGVEHRERFAPYIDPSRILPVIIDCPAERRDDGTWHQRRAADLYVQSSPRGRDFAALFSGSRAILHVLDDFLSAAWTKLCVNAPGALCAITRQPSAVLKREPMLSAALDMVRECIAVAAAEGAHLAPDILEQMAGRIHSALDDSVNSMLADRLAGRRMEIDVRNGAIVRLGAKHAIATPANRMAVALLQALEGR